MIKIEIFSSLSLELSEILPNEQANLIDYFHIASTLFARR